MYTSNLHVKNKIEQIAAAIDKVALIKDNEPGFLSGSSGYLLFFSYLEKYSSNKEKYRNKKEQVIDHLFRHIDQVTLSSFAQGLGGIGWVFSHLIQQSMLEADSNLLLEDFDEVLQKAMEYEFRMRNWDYLHGALGILLYFQNRFAKNNLLLPVLQNGCEQLSSLGEEAGEGIKWRSVLNMETGEEGYNISMSHGIASIIAILSSLHATSGTDHKKTEKLLQGSVMYLLEQQIDREQYGSYFSNYALESQEDIHGSRLAWCYGDLGIAMALWRAGQALDNETWKNKALEILLFTAEKRRNPVGGITRDTGLCHGASGVGHIFYRMWWNTRIPEFYDAASYWFDETLTMARFDNGPAGFKSWNYVTGEWYDNYKFLEGITGAGLALLTFYYQIEPAWDECLLLS